MIRTILGCLVLIGGYAVADPGDVLERAVAKADAGRVAMESYYSKVNDGDRDGAAADYTFAQSLYDEAAALCFSINPDTLGTAEEAREYGDAAALALQNDLAARGFERAFRLSGDFEAGLLAVRHWRRVGGSGVERAFDVLKGISLAERDSPSNVDEGLFYEMLTERGLLYHDQGLFELAGRDYGRVLKSSHRIVDAVIGDVVLAIRQGHFKRAFDVIGALEPLTRDQGRFLNDQLLSALESVDELRVPIGDQDYSYAGLLVRVGRNYDAMLAMEHAVLIDDSNFVKFNFLAALLIEEGHRVRGAAAYRRSLTLNPEQPRTREILEQVQSPE